MLDSDELCKIIGAHVRRVREAQSPRMSQGALAKILELQRTSITNIEHGNQKPTLDTLYRFCEHFGLEITEVVPPVSAVTRPNGEPSRVIVGGKTQQVPAKTAELVQRLRSRSRR